MKKIIILTAVLILLVTVEAAFAKAEKTFFIHIGNKTIKYKKMMYGDSENIPGPFHIYPKTIHTIKIDDKTKVLVLTTNEDCMYVSFIDNELRVIDIRYSYDITDRVSDKLFYDIDGDSMDEIIMIWSGEHEYNVWVDKVMKVDKEIDIDTIFKSKDLGHPDFFDYDRELCVYQDSVYFLYMSTGSVHKMSMLTRNPQDPTGKLYLKSMGVVTERKWKRMEDQFKKMKK